MLNPDRSWSIARRSRSVLLAVSLAALAYSLRSAAQAPATTPAQSAPAQGAPAQAPAQASTERRASQKPPATVTAQSYSAEQIQAGQPLFAARCGFCHGRDTAGGETGPDLTRSTLVAED